MSLRKVRVVHIDDITLVCLEDLIDFYSGEYADLLATHTNGHGAEAQNSETALILLFLTQLHEDFNKQGGWNGEEELDSN